TRAGQAEVPAGSAERRTLARDTPQRAQDDSQVQHEAALLDVARVVRELDRHDIRHVGRLGRGRPAEQLVFIAELYGSEVGDAGQDGQDLVGDSVRIEAHVFRHFRARAHQAHVTRDHVQELRQLIELVAAQEAARARDARILAYRDLAPATSLAMAHGPEL